MLDSGHIGHELVVDEASDADHSHAAIDEFDGLVLTVCFRVLPEAEGVECKLSWLARGVEGEHLEEGRDANDGLEDGDPEQKLVHGAVGDTPVVYGVG